MISDEERKKVFKFLKKNVSVREIVKITGVSKSSAGRLRKEVHELQTKNKPGRKKNSVLCMKKHLKKIF